MDCCEECRYWVVNESYPTDNSTIDNTVLRAECRRFPEYQDRHANDWCGEFKRRDEER